MNDSYGKPEIGVNQWIKHNHKKILEAVVEWFIVTGKKKVEIPGGGKTYVLRFSVMEHEDDLF